eukprot:TRINITY_DN16888_c1_g1_i1.p1 TRINITY_DN16888_c1_g1~~TRINITY_DN16888_c1_g1_i1.p1  ORF type:complete len:296 (-),score=65.95 TRINITY_DN16888_c1_g1_i1:34-858(-)
MDDPLLSRIAIVVDSLLHIIERYGDRVLTGDLARERQREEARVLSTIDNWNPALIRHFVQLGFKEQLRSLCVDAFNSDNEDLYQKLTKGNIAPFDDEIEDEEVWIQFKEALFNKSPSILTASLRFFRAGEFEYLWKDDLPTLIQQAEMIPTETAGLGSITRIICNQSEDQDRAKNLSELLEVVWEAYLEEVEDDQMKRAQVDRYLKALKTAIKAGKLPFEDSTLWTEHAFRNLLIESLAISSPGAAGAPTMLFCSELDLNEQPFLDALRPSLIE